MTSDPIRTAAQQLKRELGTRFRAAHVDLIDAAFRQQRAEAERECEEMRKGWRYTEHRAEAAEAEVSRLRAALQAVEFVNDGQGDRACPWCGGYQALYPHSPNPHKAGCVRQAALQGEVIP